MYMKVFPHGKGSGDMPTRYLVRTDYPGRQETPPEVVRGDPTTTSTLIDSIDRQWKFTAGALSWHPDDTITPAQEARVMDDFEAVAFAGLEPDQRNILWVRHRHAGRHELHFVIPRLDLASGRDFNACPPGWRKDFDIFRDLHNHREGWARPDDPGRARARTPDHADLHRARLIRWGEVPGKDERAEVKDAIHTYLTAKIEQGLVKNRKDLLTALKEAGLSINREGKEYITVKDPESGEKLRLKGGIYAEQWNFAAIPDRTDQGEDRARRSGTRAPDPATVRKLEQEFGRILAKRAQYNRKRYPQRHVKHREGNNLTLPDYERGFRQDVSASLSAAVLRPAGDQSVWLGRAAPVQKRSSGLATGDSITQGRQGGLGTNSRDPGEQDLGHNLVPRPNRTFHNPPPTPDPTRQLENRQRPGMESGVSHDRTGKNAQRYADPNRTGLFTLPGRPGQDTGRSATRSDGARPELTATSGGNQPGQDRGTILDEAIGRLGWVVQTIGTLVVALEQQHIERQVERAREKERSRGTEISR